MINLAIQQLSQLDTEGYYLDISAEMIESAHRIAQNRDTDWGKNNAFLHWLCWQTIQPWLRENYEIAASDMTENPLWCLSHGQDVWELTNGLGCEIQQFKLAIIPSLDLDTDEFVVPQEWVDLPDFVADHYVAIQMNFEENYAYIWGFASHAMVKNQGVYDAQGRVYRLSHPQMITDCDIIWLMQALGKTERAPIAPFVPPLSTELDSIFATVSPAIAPILRRQMPLEMWSAILNHPGDRQRLIERLSDRITVKENVNLSVSTTMEMELEQANVQPILGSALIQLGQWVSEEVDALSSTWTNLAQLINPSWQWATVRGGGAPQAAWQSKGTLVELAGIDQPLVLGVAFRETDPSTYEIWIELYPSPQQQTLPRGLRLQILDTDNTVVMAVESEATTPYLRLNLAAESQDQFTVLLQGSSSEASFRQTFRV